MTPPNWIDLAIGLGLLGSLAWQFLPKKQPAAAKAKGARKKSR